MTSYVVGFMFSPGCSSVVLIRKNKPEWQAGYLNGVGGKIEEKETPKEAMAREFLEEAGVHTSTDSWRYIGAGRNPQAKIYVFAQESGLFFYAHSKTSETILTHFVSELPQLKVMPNLRWLIPMAINKLTRDGSTPDPSLHFTLHT